MAPQDEADRVITMFVAPGVSESIRPEDVIRHGDETDADYAARQALTVELWSIPDSGVEATLRSGLDPLACHGQAPRPDPDARAVAIS